MFNDEFYPTPNDVAMQMITGLDLAGKVVLEPSAGSGALIEILKQFGAEVLACEKHPDLAKIAQSKADKFLCPDFLQLNSEPISHIDYIVMNPPFSNADKHIQHAWDIAPEGCEIVALCNIETVNNRYSTRREVLIELIKKHGNWQSIGEAFSNADRKTNVEVALIRMFKPRTGNDEFDGYFFDMNDEQETVVEGSGIMRHNELREIVNRYVAAVKMFDSVIEASTEINRLINPISDGLGIAFGAYQTYTSRGVQHGNITRDVFKKELQKSAWKSVFNKMKMEKYVTRGVMADINKFVEQQQAVPFTMVNIYKMVEIIFGTHAGRMDRCLVEVFDRICSLSSDNSEAGEKWKTNSNYKINRRFIDTWVCEYDNRWPSDLVKIRVGARDEHYDDMIKALCLITGKKYDDVMQMEYSNGYGSKNKCNKTLYNFFSENKTPWGEWIQWNDFLRVRGYKKGTMHFEFVDENVWMEFNRRVAKIKGWSIPQKTDKKQTGKEKTKTTKVDIYNY